jgi:ABC-type nitrate/sulfonate/bicarbonate transport system substrate-binding protein
MNRTLRSVALVVLGMLTACHAAVVTPAAAAKTVTIRFGVIPSGGGAELPATLVADGISTRYHLKVEIVGYATPGQQFTLVRGGAADLVPGNVLDLERQRRAGLKVHAIGTFQRFSSPIVVKADSPITSFAQLSGRRVGEFGPTTIDWLAARTAGVRATGFDLAHTHLTQTSPALLQSLLARGRIDAALQFASLAAGPVSDGDQRVVTTVPDLLRQAGFNPDVLDVVWQLTDAWRAKNPGVLDRLRAAMAEAYAKLRSGDAATWAPLVKRVGITKPVAARAFIGEEIANIDPPYTPALLRSTQQLIDAISATAGPKAVGFSALPADDFLFP